MVKKQSLFQNKLFQATIIVSIIMLSSGFFMSQTDKMFGKAASSTITGTMVLMDKPTGSTLKNGNFSIYLPTETCNVSVIRCGSECISDSYQVTGTTRFDFDVYGIGAGGATGISSYSSEQRCYSKTIQPADAGGYSDVYVTITHSGCCTGCSTGQGTYLVTLPWTFNSQDCDAGVCTVSASTWYTLGEINYVAASYSCTL
ncbi:hypothetical protein GQ473_06400 [archaeon]|nr:hypothetical protein [archaeon]